MDVNSGERWSKIYISDLTNDGRTMADTASFLCRARMRFARRRRSLDWSSAEKSGDQAGGA
jgi:hypothetical protein